jgi:hypothetical protein
MHPVVADVIIAVCENAFNIICCTISCIHVILTSCEYNPSGVQTADRDIAYPCMSPTLKFFKLYNWLAVPPSLEFVYLPNPDLLNKVNP